MSPDEIRQALARPAVGFRDRCPPTHLRCLLREYQRGEALVLQADTSIADELYR